MSAETRSLSPRDSDSPRAKETFLQFIGFRLDGEDYAVAITKIREIILLKPITRVPQAPYDVEGLINLRGDVLPVINLRKRFGLPPRAFDDETRTIVFTVHDKTLGCIVDEVTEVMRIASDQVQPVPVSVSATSRQYIDGLAKLEDRLVIILNLDNLFDPAGLALPSPVDASLTRVSESAP